MKLAFESVDSVKDLNRKKGEGRKRNLMLFFLPYYWSWNILFHLLLPSDWLYTTGSPASWAFRIELSFTTIFPGSPPCRLQIVRLLSLHNHLNQFSSIFSVLFFFVSLDNFSTIPLPELHFNKILN